MGFVSLRGVSKHEHIYIYFFLIFYLGGLKSKSWWKQAKGSTYVYKEQEKKQNMVNAVKMFGYRRTTS